MTRGSAEVVTVREQLREWYGKSAVAGERESG
jgi:hypothetical protein